MNLDDALQHKECFLAYLTIIPPLSYTNVKNIVDKNVWTILELHVSSKKKSHFVEDSLVATTLSIRVHWVTLILSYNSRRHKDLTATVERNMCEDFY